MLKTFILSTMAIVMMTACVYEPATPTVAPRFEYGKEVSFVDVFGKRTELSLFDYSSRASTAAISYSDNPDATALPTSLGTVVFSFDQLLDGYTVETPLYKEVDGVPVKIGQGNWRDAFHIVTDFAPNPAILKYLTSSSSDPLDNTDAVTGEYHPDGGWPIAPEIAIYQFPPPAIVIRPTSPNGFISGDTVILHLVANQVKGISGEYLPPAVNEDGEPITLTLSDDSVVLIAATVIFQVP